MMGKMRIIIRCIVTLGMVIMVLAGISCDKAEESEEIVRPVRYEQVFSTGGSRERTFSGVAHAGLESKLSFKVPGTVKKITVEVGDRVKAGQLIAELDPDDYLLKADQADASLVQARAQARNAEANYERVRALYEANNASRTDLDAARAAYESGNAAVQAAEKQLELARLQVSYARLEAPMDCDVASVDVEVNENVQAGMTIAQLTSGSQIEVEISIPEVLISRIKEGMRVRVYFDAIPDAEYHAAVTEVGVAATGLATAFPVTVRLEESESKIRPGMAASVVFRFESSDERERVMVPPVAVGEDRAGRYVYVIEILPDDPGYGITHRRSVGVGELTGEGMEVFEGLSDGDLVVTAGISRIQEGQRVKIQ
jgi:RND family efflux transporter MFP subunit